MDKKNYQKPSMIEVVVDDCFLCGSGDGPQGPGPANTRESRDFGEEE